MLALKIAFSLFALFLNINAWDNVKLTLESRTYFYVGGQYMNVSQPLFGEGEISTGQIYVEKLVPKTTTEKYPLIFIPGAGQTSTNFLNTPDDRSGWASYFLNKGYTVYLTDPTQRGRSPALSVASSGGFEVAPVSYIQKYFTTSEKFAPTEWPQAKLHTQFPGTGLVGDPSFDAFYRSQVQLQTSALISERLNRDAELALLDKIGPAILVTHSQSGPYGWVAGDARPNTVKGIIAIEPEGPPFVNETGPTGPARVDGITRLPLVYDPPVVDIEKDLTTKVFPPPREGLASCTLPNPRRKLVNLSKVPVVLVTGEASFHAPYDYCTVEFLKQTGVNVDWLNLVEKGLKGNGHFPFLEKNSDQVAGLVEGWLKGLKD
ncbi:hypothetical protein ACLMJK_007035 [Lecanora helva]